MTTDWITGTEERNITGGLSYKRVPDSSVLFIEKKDNYDFFKPRLSPSRITDCLVKRVLGYKLKRKEKQYVTTGLNWVFSSGSAFHDGIRSGDLYNGFSIRQDRLFGMWKCVSCGHVVYGYKPSYKCSCGYSFKYKETAINLNGYFKILSFIDCYISDGINRYVLELKTMNNEKFKELEQPLPDHILQSTFYSIFHNIAIGKLFKVSEDKAYILYASQGYGDKSSPFKVWEINILPSNISLLLRRLIVFSFCIENDDYIPDDQYKKIEGCNKCVVNKECIPNQYKKADLKISKDYLDNQYGKYNICEKYLG